MVSPPPEAPHATRYGASTSARWTRWVLSLRLLLHPRAGEFGDGAERRLRGVQAEQEILVAEVRIDIGRLMPMRIPAAADMHAALVLAQRDGGCHIHERVR